MSLATLRLEVNQMSEEIKKDVVVEKNDNNTEKQPKVREPRNGVVVDCVKLNVRKSPAADATILAEIPVGTKVQIIDKESTKDFYHVWTATGIDGFCMKKFIKVN